MDGAAFLGADISKESLTGRTTTFGYADCFDEKVRNRKQPNLEYNCIFSDDHTFVRYPSFLRAVS